MKAGFHIWIFISIFCWQIRKSSRVYACHMVVVSWYWVVAVLFKQVPLLELVTFSQAASVFLALEGFQRWGLSQASRAKEAKLWEGRACPAESSVTGAHGSHYFMDTFILPQATCHLMIVAWFCSWREVDLQSLKGNPDEDDEEVMAWSFSLRALIHKWVHISRWHL